MSWYTFFYPPKKWYETGQKVSDYDDKIQSQIAELKGFLIDYYYNKDNITYYQAYQKIKLYVLSLSFYEKEQAYNSYKEEAKTDKDHLIAINHFRCKTLFDIEYELKDCDKITNQLIEDLFILSRVKFIPSKEDSSESDTKNEMNYLMGDYIAKINDIVDNLIENAQDKALYQMAKEFYDTMKDESSFDMLDDDDSDTSSENKEDDSSENVSEK